MAGANEGGLTDWQVTMLFYSALHYVDALFADMSGIHPKTHTSRNTLVTNQTAIAPNYIRLYNRSLDARYNMVMFTQKEVDRIIVEDFDPIRENIRALLGIA